MSRDNLCACLALYDWSGELDTVRFHELAREFFDANGVVPNLCSVARLEGSSANRSYARMEKNLRSGPLPGADGVSLYHTLPDYAQLVFGWDVTATLDFEEDKTMVLCCDQTMAGIGLDYFEGLLDRIARHLQLCYGIGYLRPFNLGPSIYAAGMNTTSDYSDEAMAEAHRIGSWFRERIGENRHRTGHLRDVYPLNVISAPHLSQRVDGLALSDWIGRESWRGTLRTLPGEAAVWRIEEAHVERVRAELIPTGLLIAYPPAKQ